MAPGFEAWATPLTSVRQTPGVENLLDRLSGLGVGLESGASLEKQPRYARVIVTPVPV